MSSQKLWSNIRGMGLLYIKYLHYIFIKLQPFLIITHGFLENHLFFWRFSQLSTSISFGEFPTSHIYLKILICSSIFYYIRFKKKRVPTTIEPPFVMNDQPICHMPQACHSLSSEALTLILQPIHRPFFLAHQTSQIAVYLLITVLQDGASYKLVYKPWFNPHEL